MENKTPTLYLIPDDRRTAQLQPNISAPLVFCRCCGASIEPLWQPGSGRRAGCWLLTCDDESCALCNYTFSATRYNDLDLSPYLATAHTRH